MEQPSSNSKGQKRRATSALDEAVPTKKRPTTGAPVGTVSPERRQNSSPDTRNINITRPHNPNLLPSNQAPPNTMLRRPRIGGLHRRIRRTAEEEDAAYHRRDREYVEREVAEWEAHYKRCQQQQADESQKEAAEKAQKEATEKARVEVEHRKGSQQEEAEKARVEAERRKKARKEEHEKAKKEAEKARKEVEYAVALAAALRREKDDNRRAELRKDPSANYRHILEVYRLFPLENGYKERNTYLTGLLANKCMPVDKDSELGLAVTYAKDHWEFFGQWPRDTARFAQYERDRRAAVKRG